MNVIISLFKNGIKGILNPLCWNKLIMCIQETIVLLYFNLFSHTTAQSEYISILLVFHTKLYTISDPPMVEHHFCQNTPLTNYAPEQVLTGYRAFTA